VRGFLLKDTQPAELLRALWVAMRDDALLSPAVTRRLISEFVARPPGAIAAVGMETTAKSLPADSDPDHATRTARGRVLLTGN
jgi:hypothetical protein